MTRRTISAFLLAILAASCSGGGGSEIPNAPPILNLAPELSVSEGDTVQLTAAATDPNGDAMKAIWSQVSGPMITLSSTTDMAPSFQAPNVNQTETIVLSLKVTDSGGMSATQNMTITIEDTSRRGPSPQGIDDDTEDRRERARGRRNGNRPVIESREVRTYDGTNNNIDHPAWGATFEHLQRFGPVDYADGVSELAGANRPSARAVSNAIADQPEGISLPNKTDGSDFVWQWGQFIDHDLDLTDGARRIG